MPTFPISTARPSYFQITVNSPFRWGCTFLEGEPLLLVLAGASAFTGSFFVRNAKGVEVQRGTLADAGSVTLNPLPLGCYKLFLTHATNDPVYGHSAGGGFFSIVMADSRLPPLDAVAPYDPGADPVMRMNGTTWAGLSRPGAITDPTDMGQLSYMYTTLGFEFANWWMAPEFQDPVRPHREVFAFSGFTGSVPQAAGVTAMVADACATWGVDNLMFEGPSNEPDYDGASVAINMRTFYNAVKAGHPDAVVGGYSAVSIGGSSLAQIATFCNACANDPSGIPLDVFTFHFYNCANGDITMGRKSLDALVGVLATYGMDSLERWMTESGTIANQAGYFNGRLQLTVDFVQKLLLDQYGVPKERSQIYYSWSQGFWEYPSFWTDQQWHWNQMGAALRVFSQEVYGKEYLSALDFGDPGNDMLIGNRYHDPATGEDVLCYVASGMVDATLQFRTTGAWGLVSVDCYGKTTPHTAVDGIIAVPATVEPSYLRIPSGATATLVPKYALSALGPNLAPPAAVTTSGSVNNQANASRMVNGVHENEWYQGLLDAGPNNPAGPYYDDTTYPVSMVNSDDLALGALLYFGVSDPTVAPTFTPPGSSGAIMYGNATGGDGGNWHIAASSLPLTAAESPSFRMPLPVGSDTNWCAGVVAVKSAVGVDAAVVQQYIGDSSGALSVTATGTNRLLCVMTLGGVPVDSAGNTWALKAQSTTGGGADMSIYMTTATNPASITSVAVSGSIFFAFFEVSGALTSDPIETSAADARISHGVVGAGVAGDRYPAWVELGWANPTRMDRAIIFCGSSPWQTYGSLLDFDVDYWNGSSWVTLETILEPGGVTGTVDDADAMTFPNVEDVNGTACSMESFYSGRWQFDIEFGSIITTTKLRIYVRSATWGGVPTEEANDAMTGFTSYPYQDHFMIREVQVYCSDLAVERVALRA